MDREMFVEQLLIALKFTFVFCVAMFLFLFFLVGDAEMFWSTWGQVFHNVVQFVGGI